MGALQSTDEYWLDELDDYQRRKLGLLHTPAPVPMKPQDPLVGRGLAEVARVSQRGISATSALRYTSTRSLEDEYHFLPQVCGVGGDCVVRLANCSDGKLFAVKSFSHLSHMTASKKQALINEVKIGLAADHPHIVRLENVYESPEELHLVMENLTGGELFSHLMDNGQFSEENVANRTHQMLLAIAYLHQHGVAHRDLKLENWMYEQPDKKHLKLIDFGVSECWVGSAPMHQICGTTSYMAPEVFNKSYTEKADMWSLGVIVHSLLTGRSLFSGTDAEAMRKIKAGRADWSPMAFDPLSTEAKEFVKALIVADPLKRMSAAEALEHPWLARIRGQASVPIHGGLVPSLLRFASASCFKRACLCMLTWSLNPEDLEHSRKQFLVLEKEHRGAITLRRLKQSISRYGVGARIATVGVGAQIANMEKRLADMELEHALQLLDDDMEISYSEFVAAEMHMRLSTNDYALTKMFQRLDPAGIGISVANLCERLGQTNDAFDAGTIVGEINSNHSGVIGFEEFSSFLRQPLMVSVSDNSLDQSVPMYASGGGEPEPEP